MSALPDYVRVGPGAGGLPMLRVDGPEGWAEVYLHGAHVTAWGPSGLESRLWLSRSSRFDGRTAIRGGIPVCFPWFGPLAGRPGAPAGTGSHGRRRGPSTARRTTGTTSRSSCGSPTPPRLSGRPGRTHRFTADCTVVVGSRLSVALEVTNTGGGAVMFEEALHTYLAVADVTAAEVTGLEGVAYLDKTAVGATIAGEAGPLRVAGEVDRIYPGALTAVTVHDVVGGRDLRVRKDGSGNTVVWNPWREEAHATADIDDDWTTMRCVEASNVGPAAVRLEPGAQHTMATTIEASPPASTPAG